MKIMSRENCRKAVTFKDYQHKEIDHEVVYVHGVFQFAGYDNNNGNFGQDAEPVILVELPDGTMQTPYVAKVQFLDLE